MFIYNSLNYILVRFNTKQSLSFKAICMPLFQKPFLNTGVRIASSIGK